MIKRPQTIICDIDGVLFKHNGDITKQHIGKAKLLPGALNRIKEWDFQSFTILLITGRRESVRKDTERQLTEAGVIYDHLIMGVNSGVRVLINDMKPDSTEETAIAINLERNKGWTVK